MTALTTCALLSSVAALLGAAAQANYSTANSCLDTLASWRRAEALASVSVQWGAWADVGMARRGGAACRVCVSEGWRRTGARKVRSSTIRRLVGVGEGEGKSGRSARGS